MERNEGRRSETRKEGEREREGGRERGSLRREQEERDGYGCVATPRGASQRALRRPTTHLTPQWPDPRSVDALFFPPHGHLSGGPKGDARSGGWMDARG